MPEAAVWVVAAVASYAIGVALYATFYWPWSRSQRALRRLRKHGVPLRSLGRSEARVLQLIEFPAGLPVYLLEGSCAAFVVRGRFPPAQHVQTLAGVPVKYPPGLAHAVCEGGNTAEVVLGRDHAMVVRLNGVKLAP
ncbi:hypothetical protein [Stenotrophomonas sp. NPDC077659]|uniref:hypothetical protein n=1 Tax=Stenotrophomonas sp. NPDC077659 TaxID=3390694 RepID=UPI003D001E88